MYYEPKLSVRTRAKAKEAIPPDPVEAYKAGYLDASESMYTAFTKFVTELRVSGWKEQDILDALLGALRNYTLGAGVQRTSTDILRTYYKRGTK